MDSNTYSNRPPEPPEPPELSERPAGLAGLSERPAGLWFLTAADQELAAEDPDQLTDNALTQQTLELQQAMDRLHGHWLRRLATVDARGAAGADQNQPAASTASGLRRRLRMGAGAAREAVRTARALFCGPLPQTAAALTEGAISPAHARVLAQGTRPLPDHRARAAEPVLLQAATRLDPPQLRQAVGYLCEVADPDRAAAAGQRRHDRQGLWLAPTLDDMVAVHGLLEPEAGQTVLAALEPLARPADANDPRSGGQRTADALAEVCRRALEGGRLPRAGGVRPQLLVTVDHDSLLGRPGAVGGDLGWAGPLDAEGCRRLACDGAVTRVLVSRQPPTDHQHDPGADRDPGRPTELQQRLQADLALLPPTLGGAPSQPLDLGRATRVVSPAQRSALAVRDRGCVFPGCDRPLSWCDAHHLISWIDGGPTDLPNLALVCRAHHRAVHEGGWHLARGPDGRFTAAPGRRRHRPAA
jgi:hypothetical protein